MLNQQANLSSLSARYTELDALRGIAALVVMLRHYVNVWPYSDMGTLFFLLLRSPLRLIFAAHEAVLLFYLLSGFVLALPFLGEPVPYPAFLVRRVFRIYLPYLGALAIAISGTLLLNGPIPQLSTWFNLTWTDPVTLSAIIHHVWLIGAYPNGAFNTAFWSLVYEMRVSFIFPLLFWLTAATQPLVALVLAIGISALACTFHSDPYSGGWIVTLHFAGFFVVGILLARNRDAICRSYERLSPRLRFGLAAIGLFCITYGAGPPAIRARLGDFTDWVTVAGLVWLLVVTLSSERVGQFLRSPLPQFLGRISYSLYLVHATVLFALVHIFYGRIALIALFPVYVAVSVGLAGVMHRRLEVPTMARGRAVARALASRRAGLRA